MSLFMQYNLAQAMGDLGAGGGVDACGFSGADAAGAGMGFGFGVMLPYLIARHYQWPSAFPYGQTQAVGYGPPLPPAAPEPRFCGHCGGGLIAQANFCGHCGQSVLR